MPAHYNSIDAPIYVWEKVHESSDLTYLLKRRKKTVSKKIMHQLGKAWDNIYDEYMDEFGKSDELINILMKRIEIARLQAKKILTNDKSIVSFIQIAEQELSEMTKDNNKAALSEVQIYLETRLKFPIDTMTTSIRKFYQYLKYFKNV